MNFEAVAFLTRTIVLSIKKRHTPLISDGALINRIYTLFMKTLVRYIIIAVISLVSPLAANAFPTETYAQSSVLSSGRWVKISVSETGLHYIPASTLRSWGFSDPTAVKIFGYGGARISDQLTKSLYVDDLPVVRSEQTAGGIVFYAQGPGVWTHEANDVFTHSLNPYSNYGYYYLTDSQSDVDSSIPTEGSEPSAFAESTFIEHLYHESDLTTPAESGHQLVGEDFRYTSKRTFNFPLTGRVEGTEVWMQCDFFARCESAPVRLNFTANGQTLESLSTDAVSKTSEWGNTAKIRKRFTPSGSSLALGVGITISAPVTNANLDRLLLTYTRELALPSSTGTLEFSSSARSLKLGGAKSDTRVWDVTNPNRAIAMPLSSATDDGVLGWTNDYSGMRRYVAWSSATTLPVPRLSGAVANQNIHGESTPDMIIVTPSEFLEQSRRVAAIHSAAPDSLNVLIVTSDQVYNEFGSGAPDVNAIRRMLKMFYDRGSAAAGVGSTLKYVLLMGGAHHDHRRLTAAMSRSSIVTLPIWQSELCESENTSYCSDDYLAFLEDGSGLKPTIDKLCVAVGRIPARGLSTMKTYVDRLVAYAASPVKSEWRNRFMFFADDDNEGKHMLQTEAMESEMRASESGRGFTYNKVYIDAYELSNGTSAEAQTKIQNLFNDGVVLWSFVGHGSIDYLTNENVFTQTTLSNLYLRHPLFFFGATCSFGRLDGNATSGMESLMLTDGGGSIGGLTAVRPVYIDRNGVLAAAFGREFVGRGSDGRFNPIGEVVRRAKNSLGNDDNIRRYVLFCDPALRLATPANTVRLLSVDGVEVSDDSQPMLTAQSRPTLHGEVCDPSGQRMVSFDGWISLSLYDAERSFTTYGRGETGKEVTFDEQGERLYTGRAKVTGGVFDVTVAMPSEIADNYRPATLSMFAAADDGREASGVCRNLYAYGLDESVLPDTVAPVIESLYLNHSSFKPDVAVDANPMLIARVSDDVGINMSSAGIGHQMTIRLDDDKVLTDVSSQFTPDDDGSPAGSIFYQLPELSAGNHKAQLRVWDTGGNSATASIDFFVNPDVAPKIFDVYSNANPATTEADFYVSHNRPDATLTVKIEVFDFKGSLIWSSETLGRADMYASAPVTWDLTDRSGSKVGRGIYIYRATVSSGGDSSSLSKRLAVAPK